MLMIPFPFLMVGCCLSKTTVLQLDSDKKILSIKIYPGLFSCCRKEYEVSFGDILKTKTLVSFNRRINKRQAYQLYLETRIGDFELTAPKAREDIICSKNELDAFLKLNGAVAEWRPKDSIELVIYFNTTIIPSSIKLRKY